jgi:hypothetical protein
MRLEQGSHRPTQPFGFAFGLEGFLEVGDFDGGHDAIVVEISNRWKQHHTNSTNFEATACLERETSPGSHYLEEV